jgi:uncharacterized membrane protein YkvA (DUF1232 family)
MATEENKPSKAIIINAVEKTKSKAEEYIHNPDKSKQLLDAALKKSKQKEKSKGPLGEIWESLMALFRLLRAYIRREYTAIPWGSIVLVVVAIIYFVSPIDLIPDWLPLAGFIDDAAVIAFVIAQIKVDLDTYLKWEANKPIRIRPKK